MAWLHNNGDEDEFARFEGEEPTDPEPLLEEEGEEEIVVTERAVGSVATPPRVSKPASKPAARPKAKARKAKPKPKAKSKKKAKAKPKAKKKPAKKAKRGKRR